MNLKTVTIENFRSIKKMEIDIQKIAAKECLIFFGINETGKSNILKAIALFREDRDFNYDVDCEKNARRQNKDVVITYSFDVGDDEDIKNEISGLHLPATLLNQIKIKRIEKQVSFDKDSDRGEWYNLYFDDIMYDNFIHIKKEKEIITQEHYENSLQKEIEKEVADGIRTAKDSSSDGGFEKLTPKILDEYIESRIRGLLDKLTPELIFWESSPKYLITEPIDLNEFKKDSNISIPLKNMFSLIDVNEENLEATLERIKKYVDERSTIEEMISEKITKHINDLWPEHKINISVRIEGNNLCAVSVEDKDNRTSKFNMEQRSDGFKQFMSILLTLSVENKTNQLKNKIILLDEPNRSLHPSGIKYMRDEFLNISRNNVIMVTSHSIFMVDKKNLDRHYTVKKEKGSTSIERIDPENPFQEEVIYEALGTSIYEIIEPNMLIFEGSTDKHLFDIFTRKMKTIIKPLAIRSISATGAKQIPKYVKFFDQKLIKGYVVVDSDHDGRAAKKSVLEQNPEFKNKTYEILELIKLEKQIATIEDILPENIVLSAANELYNYTFPSPRNKSIIEHIKEVKLTQGIKKDANFKDLKVLIINKIILDIKKKKISDVEKEYPLFIEFITNLHQKIKDNS